MHSASKGWRLYSTMLQFFFFNLFLAIKEPHRTGRTQNRYLRLCNELVIHVDAMYMLSRWSYVEGRCDVPLDGLSNDTGFRRKINEFPLSKE